jgi:hypothetical protein
MSVETHLRFGAYAECINPVTRHPVMARRCINSSCVLEGKKTDTPFCGYCGKPTAEYQTGTQSIPAVNHWDIDVDETLFHHEIYGMEGVDIWLSNISGVGVEFNIDIDGDGGVLEIPDPAHSMASHIANFMQHYAPALDMLREAYGADNVKVKWGVVTYVM